MTKPSQKPRRRSGGRDSSQSLPWSDPTVEDVHGWVREAFENVADAKSSVRRRLRRGDDALHYMHILRASWAHPECSAEATEDEVMPLFSRAESTFQKLLNIEALGGSAEQDCNAKAAEKVAMAMIEMISASAGRIYCGTRLIAGLRRAAVGAARFAASAGSVALLDTAAHRGGGTTGPAHAAQLASLLYRTADHHEGYLASLH